MHSSGSGTAESWKSGHDLRLSEKELANSGIFGIIALSDFFEGDFEDMDQSIILLVVMFAALYFFMIRPENKRKKQAQAMRDGLKKGDVSPASAALSVRS